MYVVKPEQQCFPSTLPSSPPSPYPLPLSKRPKARVAGRSWAASLEGCDEDGDERT